MSRDVKKHYHVTKAAFAAKILMKDLVIHARLKNALKGQNIQIVLRFHLGLGFTMVRIVTCVMRLTS